MQCQNVGLAPLEIDFPAPIVFLEADPASAELSHHPEPR